MKTNKDLKEAYKQKKFRIGVFQIKNKVNGKVYVDSSINLDAIRNRNLSELRAGGHRNEMLQKEWNEYGEDSFQFEILSEIEQKDGDNTDYGKEAKQLADMYIDELKPFGEKGYNRQKR